MILNFSELISFHYKQSKQYIHVFRMKTIIQGTWYIIKVPASIINITSKGWYEHCFSFPSSQQNVGFLKVCKYVLRLYLFLFGIMIENFHTIFIVLTFHSLFIAFRCRFFMAFCILFTFEFRKCCESFDVCWVTIQYMKG